jgi:hypothetical protein
MSNPSRRGPRELSEILGELFTVRGYGQLRALSELEEAWNTAVGEPHCHQTRLGEIRRGVVNVTVAHPTLLEELSAFRKPELLAALRACTPGATIHDIRFRVGPVDNRPESAQPTSPANPQEPPAGRGQSGLSSSRHRRQHRSPAKGDHHDRNTGMD